MDKYFLIQIKRTRGVIEKGVVVKDTLDAAKQSYHSSERMLSATMPTQTMSWSRFSTGKGSDSRANTGRR